MAATANFASAPRQGNVLVTTSNTNCDGTAGVFAIVFTAGASGSRIDSLQIKGIVAEGSTQAADTVRLWMNNGVTNFFLKEVLVAAGGGVISATVANFESTQLLGIQLPVGWSLRASTKVGGALASYHLTAVGGDY